ncbi:putative hydrolase of the HAD superfamily [Haloactinospora alba]|uniref:Putative hydrolase of the HAD superfamily n=1 Tax=Haloactinospora alba TaxID=405555 RepID=A0A543NK71_9ACTN|nr:HAD family phosphatase [Haloactinospora alba]TQN32263.1 putative hydrolase of the HAD superfamily [Haloactinospora alba]
MDTTLPAAPADTTVIFDYGGVLSQPQPPEAVAELERLAGVPAPDFWAAYWDQRRSYDGGLTAVEYWDRVAHQAGAEWDTSRTNELWAADVSSWLHVAPESVDLLHRAAATGANVALLSNAPAGIANALRSSPALSVLRAQFFSCDLRICKPDPAIYTRVLDALDLPPERSVFVDDREENVQAALRLGIDAHRFTGSGELESFLTQRLGPV